jgi:hypothetical protein
MYAVRCGGKASMRRRSPSLPLVAVGWASGLEPITPAARTGPLDLWSSAHGYEEGSQRIRLSEGDRLRLADIEAREERVRPRRTRSPRPSSCCGPGTSRTPPRHRRNSSCSRAPNAAATQLRRSGRTVSARHWQMASRVSRRKSSNPWGRESDAGKHHDRHCGADPRRAGGADRGRRALPS